MLISTRGRYALRVLTDMAEHQAAGYVPLKEIAARQEISEKYLESIVKALVADGVLVGLRGKGGGYRLVKAPDEYKVGDILRLMENGLAPVACLEDGAQPCQHMAECRTLPMWRGLNTAINDYLDKFSIADLMKRENDNFDFVI